MCMQLSLAIQENQFVKERQKTLSSCLGNRRRTTEAGPSQATLSRNVKLDLAYGQRMFHRQIYIYNLSFPLSLPHVVFWSVADWPLVNVPHPWRFMWFWAPHSPGRDVANSKIVLSLVPGLRGCFSPYNATKLYLVYQLTSTIDSNVNGIKQKDSQKMPQNSITCDPVEIFIDEWILKSRWMMRRFVTV